VQKKALTPRPLGTQLPRKQHDFSDAYAQQVTRRPSDCQLAAVRNHPTLALPCAHQLTPAQIFT
jgi:hypothetical protein